MKKDGTRIREQSELYWSAIEGRNVENIVIHGTLRYRFSLT